MRGLDMEEFGTILDGVRAKIAAACAKVGRDPTDVEIVAVTKTHGAEVVRADASVSGKDFIAELALPDIGVYVLYVCDGDGAPVGNAYVFELT